MMSGYEKMQEAKLARGLLEAKQTIERLTLEVNKLATECGHREADVVERDNQIAELEQAIVRLTEEAAEQRKEIERLQEDLAECRRLLREAVLRDVLVDERWFREAKEAGGE